VKLQRSCALTALLLAGLAARCAPVPATPAGPAARDVPIDTALALLTFDSAWSRIATTHYAEDYGGTDWTGVRAELRPLAAEAGTLGALRRVIEAMLDRLDDSHYALIPREAADALEQVDGGRRVSGDAGVQVRLVGDEMVVWRVDPDGAGAAAGVRTGWTLLGVAGRPYAPRIAALRSLPAADQRTALTRLLYAANAELAGEAGQEVTLLLLDADRIEVRRTVELRPTRGEVVRFGNLPPVIAVLEQERIDAAGVCVGLIRLNIWVVPLAAAFDAAIDATRDCAGIVVDIRGNPGGVAGMVMGTAGHFLNDTLPLGFMRTRTSELRFKANPRRVRRDGSPTQPFAGPVAVLIDEMSASTSEFFAAGLQGVGRARVFGSGSAGQALPALLVRLPTGDVLMHVVADFTGPGGVRIEGRGVLPDVRVASTRQDLLEQRDAPLDAALQWITGVTAAGQQPGGSQP
jgi:carboxyl-terminal processing protease